MNAKAAAAPSAVPGQQPPRPLAPVTTPEDNTKSSASDHSSDAATAATLAEVTFGAIKPAAEDTFGSRKFVVPDDHPLMKAFRQSFETEQGIDVETPDTDGVTKLLRRIASQEGKGVAIKYPRKNVVAFLAQERKVVRRKKSADTE